MRFAGLLAMLFAARCVSAPSQTPGQLALARNPRAIVAGRVLDSAGRPAPGVQVEAVPRSRDVLWSEPATTDPDGRFELSLFAPAAYSFLLCRGDICVVTDDPSDPSRTQITVNPAERYDAIELRFLYDRWDTARPLGLQAEPGVKRR